MLKLACPITVTAFIPLANGGANPSKRLFLKSATQRFAKESSPAPTGSFIPLAPAAAVCDEKPGWPSTTPAF